MAESKTIEVKLVRCPNCKNLLPEPRDCSFFKCGGCGSVLCAKNKDRVADPVLDKSVKKNRAEETEVNSASSEEESDSNDSSRHQQTGTWDDVPCLNLNVVNDSQSGLDRSNKTEGFRFSASNYFSDSISSDEAIQQDRAELVRKLDKLKEHLLQPKEQQIPRSSSRLKKAPLRFPSSGKHLAGPYGAPLSFHQMQERPLQQSHHHYSREYTSNNGHHDLFNTHMLHHSTCSCFHCYDPYHRASGSVYPPSGLPDALHNIGFYPYERTTAFPSPLHSPRSFIPPHAPGSQSRGLDLHGRLSNELGDTLKNAISRVRAAKAVSSSGGSRLVHPVAGGAPFINCKKCSKLLKLPDVIDSSTRKQQRLRCGACSCLIDFYFADKKLILSTDPASARKDCDNDAYQFNAMARGPDYVSTGPTSDKAQEMQVADSTSTSFSEDELSSDSPTGKKLIPDLSLLKHYDYSSINLRDRSGPRRQSSRSEQNIVSLSKTIRRQNSMKEASVLNEMDVNDYSHNNGVSQDSADDYREDDGRTRQGGFASMVKSSFKDLKKTIQNEGSSDVLVNGHLVAERLVKMAEKQAGPIRPGNYWYDYRAGFWGVMGGQCLGILPVNISHRKSLKHFFLTCVNVGGTTRVFVNGRELHQKDLRLLIARGLPRDRDRSYTVYITGRVIDEDTGEELDSLGKLAPTVDKLKRGFGMRVPRRYA